MPESTNPDVANVEAYIPLNYEASKLIASEYVGDCEGKWCTAYQRTDNFWKQYTGKGIVLIYIIINLESGETKKIAIAYSPLQMSTENFDQADDSISDVLVERETGINYSEFLDSKYIMEAQEMLVSGEYINFDVLRGILGGSITDQTLEDHEGWFDRYHKIEGNDVYIRINEHDFQSMDTELIGEVFFQEDFPEMRSHFNLPSDYISNYDLFVRLINISDRKVEAGVISFLKENGFTGDIDDLSDLQNYESESGEDFEGAYPELYRSLVSWYSQVEDTAYESKVYDEVYTLIKEVIEEIGSITDVPNNLQYVEVKLHHNIIENMIDYAEDSGEEEYIDVTGYIESENLLVFGLDGIDEYYLDEIEGIARDSLDMLEIY